MQATTQATTRATTRAAATLAFALTAFAGLTLTATAENSSQATPDGIFAPEDGGGTGGFSSGGDDREADPTGAGTPYGDDMIEPEDEFAGIPGREEDFNNDGFIDVDDLITLLMYWGKCEDPGQRSCPWDLNRDGGIDEADLVSLFAAWD